MMTTITNNKTSRTQLPGWLWGAIAQWPERLHAAKAGGPGFDSP